jgi:hypothetical protein
MVGHNQPHTEITRNGATLGGMATDPYAELRLLIHGRRRAVRDLEPHLFKRRAAAPVIERSESPCVDCPKSDRCTGQQLGCAALEVFENQGRYSAAPRQPSHAAWLALYGEDE